MGKLKNITKKIIKDIDEGHIEEDKGFEKLYNLFSKRIYFYIKENSSFNRAEIEDIVQETFIKVHKSLKDYNRKYAFSTWVYKISKNIANSEYRKKRKLKAFVGKDLPLSPDDLRNPEKMYDKKRSRGLITKAIEDLPAKYQNPFSLHEKQNFEYEEIEKILKIPIGTVKSRIYRAKVLLMKKLGPYFPEHSNNRNDHDHFKKVKAI